MVTKIYNRFTKLIYEEKQFMEKQLKLLYHTAWGRILLKLFFTTSLYSKLNGYYNHSTLSVKKIMPFIKEYDIDMRRYEDIKYKSFNDFFARKIKPETCANLIETDGLIAVADSKLLVYDINDNTEMYIKNRLYTIEDLLNEKELSKEYKNGLCLVFRLTVDDYHRYIYFDDGKLKINKKIRGKLHTVSPISFSEHKVYSENSREYTVIETKNCGVCVYMEVGALQVGKIRNHQLTTFNKGQEKGYFELGGSTIVLFLKKGVVELDKDIKEHSERNIETKVMIGERIGKILC